MTAQEQWEQDGRLLAERGAEATADVYAAYYRKHLYARIQIPSQSFRLDGITAPGAPGAFVNAMRAETARALAEVNAQAVASGFILGPGRWEDADGNVLQKIEAPTHAERRRLLAQIRPEDRFVVLEDE